MNGIKNFSTALLGLICLFMSSISWAADANYTFDLNTFYFSDAFTHSTATTNTRTFYSASLNLAVDKSKTYMIGWSVLGFMAPETTTTNVTYTASDMGLRFQLNMGKNNSGILAVTYNLQATTKYNGSGQEETLRGTSILVELGATPDVTDYMNVGFKLMYYAPTFKESLIGTTTYSQVAYKRATIFPAASIAWRF